MKKLILILSLCLPLVGCAAYSACVKAQVGPTLKTVTALEIEQQANAILNVGLSGDWVHAGIAALVDTCTDTNCKALVSCAVQAWKDSHPAAKPAVKAAAQAFLDEKPTVECVASL